MKRIGLFISASMISVALQAQRIKVDRELQGLVEVVVSLRQPDNFKKESAANAMTMSLSADNKWTLMDELKDQNNGECLLTKKMRLFNLNPIMNGILTTRLGENTVPGHFLNGEDSRFNYSMIEKGIKAPNKHQKCHDLT